MLSKFILWLSLFISLQAISQENLYSLEGDTITFSNSERHVFVFYTNKSCLDCFSHLNDFLKREKNLTYYFVIEKTSSPILNYEIYKKLQAMDIDKTKIAFTLINTGEISPFLKIKSKGKESKIPYTELFDDKKEMNISKKIIVEIKNL